MSSVQEGERGSSSKKQAIGTRAGAQQTIILFLFFETPAPAPAPQQRAFKKAVLVQIIRNPVVALQGMLCYASHSLRSLLCFALLCFAPHTLTLFTTTNQVAEGKGIPRELRKHYTRKPGFICLMFYDKNHSHNWIDPNITSHLKPFDPTASEYSALAATRAVGLKQALAEAIQDRESAEASSGNRNNNSSRSCSSSSGSGSSSGSSSSGERTGGRVRADIDARGGPLKQYWHKCGTCSFWPCKVCCARPHSLRSPLCFVPHTLTLFTTTRWPRVKTSPELCGSITLENPVSYA